MLRALSLIAALIAFAPFFAAPPALAGEIRSSVDPAGLPNAKSTPLGLYLTPADAHAALTDDPAIVFLDVRDPIEIGFVGHAAGVDAIVPLAFATHEFDPKGGRYKMTGNPRFLEEAEAAIARAGGDASAPIFVICRSGARSAAAARALVDAGYANVWNLVEGFEGDRDKATGARSVNGWRNAGLPWSYKIAPEAGWRPAE